MCLTSLTSVLLNNNRSSDAELKSNFAANRMMSNAHHAAGGDVPIFAAHNTEKNLHSNKIMNDTIRTALNSLAESSEKQAKERAREMFTFG